MHWRSLHLEVDNAQISSLQEKKNHFIVIIETLHTLSIHSLTMLSFFQSIFAVLRQGSLYDPMPAPTGQLLMFFCHATLAYAGK
jgi:hypothetical protein